MAVARIEPGGAVASRFELEGRLAAARQVDGVEPAWFGQAISAVVGQLVMRLGLPPRKAGEEIHDMRIALKHDHAVIAAAVDPAAAGVGPVAGAATGGFAGRLVAASHIDLPGGAAHVLGGSASG